MGQKPRHADLEKLGLGVVVAAASDKSLVGSVALVNRGLELSRLSRLDRNALARHLNGIDDEPWLPRDGRRRFREAVGGLLTLTRRSGALGDRGSLVSTIAARGGFRQLYGPTRPATDDERLVEQAGTSVLLLVRAAWRVVDEIALESPLPPLLRQGCQVVFEEILQGNLYTFRCASCGNIGFVIGRRPGRFCSKRCNSTGPSRRAQEGEAKDFKTDIAERLQRR